MRDPLGIDLDKGEPRETGEHKATDRKAVAGRWKKRTYIRQTACDSRAAEADE